jgi:hypothetical protein
MKGFSLKPSNKAIKNGPRLNFLDENPVQREQGPVKVSAIRKGKAVLDERHVVTEVEKETLIIKPLPNRDWKSATKVKVYVPRQQSQVVEPVEGKNLEYGLNAIHRLEPQAEEKVEEGPSENIDRGQKQETEDDLARNALLNNGDSGLVIPMPDEYEEQPLTEEEAYRNDVDSRPDAPDFEAYERIPVEEFGAALLRGMGWQGEEKGRTTREERDTRRPAFLGVGARPVSTGLDELGSWGKGSRASSKAEKVYVPLVKVSKETGKVIEDEGGVRSSKEPEQDRKRTKDYDDNGPRKRNYDNDRYRDYRKYDYGSHDLRADGDTRRYESYNDRDKDDRRRRDRDYRDRDRYRQ